MIQQRAMNPAEWGLLLGLSILWGGSYFFIGVAVKELPPLTIMLLRVGIAALALNLAMRAMKQALPFDRHIWLAFLGMGLMNNVIPQTLIVWGQTQIPSGLASILNALGASRRHRGQLQAAPNPAIAAVAAGVYAENGTNTYTLCRSM